MSNLNYLSEYSPFQTTQELNAAVNDHIKRNQYELNGTDRDVLIMVSQYAVKYNGVAHLKLSTIADIIGKSIQTARRALNKLAEYNIIKRQSFMKPISGGNGANIYIILPYDDTPQMIGRKESVKPAPPTEQAVNSENEPITYISNTSIKETSYEPFKRPYSRFKDAVHTFLGDRPNADNNRLLYRLYGVYLAQTKALRTVYGDNELIDIAINAIRATFHATKRKDIRNLSGYFNGVISNKLDDLGREAMAELWANVVANT